MTQTEQVRHEGQLQLIGQPSARRVQKECVELALDFAEADWSASAKHLTEQLIEQTTEQSVLKAQLDDSGTDSASTLESSMSNRSAIAKQSEERSNECLTEGLNEQLQEPCMTGLKDPSSQIGGGLLDEERWEDSAYGFEFVPEDALESGWGNIARPLIKRPLMVEYKYERPWQRTAAIRFATGETIAEIARSTGRTSQGVRLAVNQQRNQETMQDVIYNGLKPTFERVFVKALPGVAKNLVRIATNNDGEGGIATKDQIKAGEVVMNRVLGMPTQPIEDGRTKNPREMTDEELLTEIIKQRETVPVNMSN